MVTLIPAPTANVVKSMSRIFKALLSARIKLLESGVNLHVCIVPSDKLTPTPAKPVLTQVPVPATVLMVSVEPNKILRTRQKFRSVTKTELPSGWMAIPLGLEKVLVNKLDPSVLPAVHTFVSEQLPAQVVTDREVRFNLLRALLFVSVIRA